MTREEALAWVREQYGTEPDFPFQDDPVSAVLRNRQRKWYGLLMKIPRKKLGLEEEGLVDILNIKADPELVDILVDNVGFFRAYHMSKTKWMTVLLDGTVPEKTVKNLLSDSYALVHRKKERAKNG